jgi:hypothetical protein
VRVEHPTGADLVEELRKAAAGAGVKPAHFVRPLTGGNSYAFLNQLGTAKAPTPQTVARVRALIDGRQIPERFSKGYAEAPRPGRPPEIHIPGAEIEQRRNLVELAHEQRLPGETIAAAVRRLQHSEAVVADLKEASR